MDTNASPTALASFSAIDGVFNVREFGGYHSSSQIGTITRKGIIYRSGHLENITSLGRQNLADLGVTTVIDLRSSTEDKLSARLHAPAAHDGSGKSSIRYEGPGPRKILLPLDEKQFAPTRKLQLYRNTTSARYELIADEYFKLATSKTGVIALRTVLLAILEHPDDSILIHCTLGKDRTGIIFGLILSLVGVSDLTVAEEYGASQLQLIPIQRQVEGIVRTIDDRATEEEAALDASHIIEAKPENMLLLIQKIRETFGGVFEFVRDACGLTEKEIVRVQGILLEI